MKNTIFKLALRDLKRILNLRSIGIWTLMAALTIFFFFTSNGNHELMENNHVEFMAVFLPLIVFGPWAVMSVYFDLVSGDREHNVLDCILCSGVTKEQVFMAKVITTIYFSFVLALIYLGPVTVVIIAKSSLETSAVLLKYFMPLWGFIMVFAALGVMISVMARSSKAAMIWSLAWGLILMPRFFVLIPEAIGKVFHLSTKTIENISMFSPGIMMEALSNPADKKAWIVAAAGFTIGVILLYMAAGFTFLHQDEYNYGE